MMENDKDYIYLDVRSVPEFEAGHPRGAINIPILHFSPGLGMQPNQDFHAVVEANIQKDAKIAIGCKTGARSARACELLSQAGYTNLANVRGGFVGAMDNYGRIVEPGWSMLDLPVSTEAGEGARYDSLAAKAKK
jgi:rhodanese-related sulfurtransferase